MASVESPNKIRVSFQNPNSGDDIPVLEFHTDDVSQSTVKPTGETLQAIPNVLDFGANITLRADEGSRVVVSAQADVAATVESEESSGRISGVLINKTTGRRIPKTLKIGDGNGDLVGFNTTQDIVLGTAQFTELGHFVVPNNFQFQLTPSKFHIFLGDNG